MPRSDWYSDTDPRALEVFLECQRRKTAEAAIRRQHPGIHEREAFLRTAARHLDRETMIQVYGWDPGDANA